MYATCVTLPTDTATAEAIEALIPGTPEGLVAHVAGPVEEGWRIVDVWESEEHSRRFQSEVLAPAMRQVLGDGARQTVVPLEVTGRLERVGAL